MNSVNPFIVPSRKFPNFVIIWLELNASVVWVKYFWILSKMTSICLLSPFEIESINDFEDAINLGTELLNEDTSLINIGIIENTIKNNINMIELIIITDSKPLGSSVLRSRKSHIGLHK